MITDLPLDKKIRIIHFRHGKSSGNTNDNDYAVIGDPFIHLVPEGDDQARALAKGLSDYYRENRLEDIDGQPIVTQPQIFTSPYQRTRETLGHVLEKLDDPELFSSLSKIHPEDRLIEQSFGLMSHLSMEMTKGNIFKRVLLKKMFSLSKDLYKKNPSLTTTFLGESKMNTYMRVDSFVSGTLARDIEQGKRDFLISSHGAVCKATNMRLFHVPLDQWDVLPPVGNCDAFEITGVRGQWYLRRIWDGEKGIAVDDNPLKDVSFIGRHNLTDSRKGSPSFKP